MWPTGLGEQSEHWILVPPTSARLLVPCIHITGTVDSAISHWNSQDVTALMNSPVVSSYKGANYYIILKKMCPFKSSFLKQSHFDIVLITGKRLRIFTIETAGVHRSFETDLKYAWVWVSNIQPAL